MAESLTDLNQESRIRKGIVVEEDSSDVSDNLSNAADEHGDREAPGPPPEAEIEMSQPDDGKQGGKDDVGGERGLVGQDAPFHGAVVEGARLIGSKCDDGVGKGL